MIQQGRLFYLLPSLFMVTIDMNHRKKRLGFYWPTVINVFSGYHVSRDNVMERGNKVKKDDLAESSVFN